MKSRFADIQVFGDAAVESTERAESFPEAGNRVFGVDRSRGLVGEAKYTADDLARYKVLKPGMFAYNPMRLNIGSIAFCSEADGIGLVSPDYVVFRCREERLAPKFCSYLIKGPEWRQWMTTAGVGSVRTRIYFRELAKMPVQLPCLCDQKRIAHILGTLDDKIELNRRMNKTLDQMARALFKSWFVDFDPVRAKMDGRQPAGMDAATAALFPSKFQESQIGLIPEGWRVGVLSDLADVIMGTSPPSETYNDIGEGVPLINGPVEFGEYYTVRSKWTTAPSRLSCAGDLVFCVRGSTTGRNVISDGEYCLGRGVCAIRGQNGSHEYVVQAVRCGLGQMLSKTTGSVFPSLSGPDISGFPVLRPGNRVIDRFCDLVGGLTRRNKANIREVETLGRIRDSLIPELLSGNPLVDRERSVARGRS